MGALSSLVSTWIRNRKIYFRIHYRYKKMFRDSRVSSLLPPPVEKLIRSNVVIEENVSINDNITQIGRCLYVGKNTTISSCDSIGSFTSISSGVRIGLMAHPSNFISTSPMFYAVRRNWVTTSMYDESEGLKTIIGNDVLISANALIRNGVTIGHGAVIGAGAFVNEDVPPYAVVAGVPAKVIRYRFDDALITRLLKSEWWNLSDEKIRNAGNFNHPEKFLDAIGA